MTTMSSDGGDAGGGGLVDNSTLGVSTLPYTSYPEYQVHLLIWKIAPPCILLLGGFGNIATIFVMRRIKDHNSSQHAILMSLAASDLVLLCSAVPSGWLRHAFRVDLQRLHVAVCKVLEWAIYTSNTASAWLVACVALQRSLAVLWPHRVRAVCTVRRTWVVILTLVLAACALDVHLLPGMEIVQGYGCFPMPGLYRHFLLVIFSWVDLCASSIGPSVCMFVCNVALSLTLFKAVSSSSSVAAASIRSSVSAAGNADSRTKVSYRTTVMVLAISCAFLVLTLPQCVYVLWLSVSGTEAMRNPQSMATAVLLRTVTFQLWYVNSAINFFLYCLTGTKFRREFVGWICCGAQNPSVPVTALGASRGERHKTP